MDDAPRPAERTVRGRTTRTLARLGAPALVAAAMTAGLPAIAAAEPAPAPEVFVPYCRALPMIMIYPPPPTRIQCHTGFGDFFVTLPPGTQWPS